LAGEKSKEFVDTLGMGELAGERDTDITSAVVEFADSDERNYIRLIKNKYQQNSRRSRMR
jgi:hypothetical protein